MVIDNVEDELSDDSKFILLLLSKSAPEVLTTQAIIVELQFKHNMEIPNNFLDNVHSEIAKLIEKKLIEIVSEDQENYRLHFNEYTRFSIHVKLTEKGNKTAFFLQYEVARDLQQEIEELKEKIESSSEELRSNQLTMVEILGIFTAILALLFTGIQTIPSDRLPSDPCDAFYYVSAVIAPFGIIIISLVALIWFITRKR